MSNAFLFVAGCFQWTPWTSQDPLVSTSCAYDPCRPLSWPNACICVIQRYPREMVLRLVPRRRVLPGVSWEGVCHIPSIAEGGIARALRPANLHDVQRSIRITHSW